MVKYSFMRWLFLLVLPILIVSWQKPVKKTRFISGSQSVSSVPDTLTLDSLVFADFFSPNGDGTNDTYEIMNVNLYQNNSLKVFNRWGEVVYVSSPYKNDWDGTNNQGNGFMGNKLTDGVYYFEFYNGRGNKANGQITLKR